MSEGPYKVISISAPTPARIEKALNDMAAEGWVLHSQPLILTHGKIAVASIAAVFVRANS